MHMEDMVAKNYADSPNVPPHLLSIEKIYYWMSKFILEIRRNDQILCTVCHAL